MTYLLIALMLLLVLVRRDSCRDDGGFYDGNGKPISNGVLIVDEFRGCEHRHPLDKAGLPAGVEHNKLQGWIAQLNAEDITLHDSNGVVVWSLSGLSVTKNVMPHNKLGINNHG